MLSHHTSSSSSSSTGSIANMVEIGIQSYWDLSSAFSASVFGTNGGLPPSNVICAATAEAAEAESSSLILDATTLPDNPNHPNHPHQQLIGFFLDPYEDHECAGSDLVVVAILAIMIFAITWWGRWFVWEPIAELRMAAGGKKHYDPTTAKRFGVTMTSILFHSTSAFFVFTILTKKDWFYSTSGWSADIGQMTIELDFKFYYLLYLARYCSDSISIFFEIRRKDFVQMVYHHIVTIGLVSCACLAGYTRLGGIVMFFFDWADLPLLTAKASKYFSLESNDIWQYVANRLFELFAIVYTITRFFMYNFVVYTCMKDLPFSQSGYIARTLLIMLAALQTFWLSLLIKAVQKQRANGGNVEDIREQEGRKSD